MYTFMNYRIFTRKVNVFNIAKNMRDYFGVRTGGVVDTMIMKLSRRSKTIKNRAADKKSQHELGEALI